MLRLFICRTILYDNYFRWNRTLWIVLISGTNLLLGEQRGTPAAFLDAKALKKRYVHLQKSRLHDSLIQHRPKLFRTCLKQNTISFLKQKFRYVSWFWITPETQTRQIQRLLSQSQYHIIRMANYNDYHMLLLLRMKLHIFLLLLLLL